MCAYMCVSLSVSACILKCVCAQLCVTTQLNVLSLILYHSIKETHVGKLLHLLPTCVCMCVWFTP